MQAPYKRCAVRMACCSLLFGGGLGGGDGLLFLGGDPVASFNPVGGDGGHGVDVENLECEGSDPEVDLVGDLNGGVRVDSLAIGGVDVKEVLLLPLIAVIVLTQFGIVLLNLLALGVGKVDFVRERGQNEGEKLAGLHSNVKEVVELSAVVVEGEVAEPDEPVAELDIGDDFGGIGPGGNLTGGLGPLEIVFNVADHAFAVVILNNLGVPAVDLVAEVKKHGALQTEQNVPLLNGNLGRGELLELNGSSFRGTHL